MEESVPTDESVIGLSNRLMTAALREPLMTTAMVQGNTVVCAITCANREEAMFIYGALCGAQQRAREANERERCSECGAET